MNGLGTRSWEGTKAILLRTDAGIGGIERASRSLTMALVDLLGPGHVGFLSVWASKMPSPCRVLFTGGTEGGGRVSVGTRLQFVLHTLRHAFAWREGLVIVACHPHLGGTAWLGHVVSRAPYAVWCHGEESWGKLRTTVRFSLRHALVVFAPSTFTACRVEIGAGLPANSVHVLPHCLTPELIMGRAPVARSRHRVLTVARLVPEHRYKGIDALIEAWPQVHETVPDAELIVVGDGADRDYLEQLSDRLQVRASVQFLGAVDDDELVRHYRRTAIFALPSRTRLDPKPEGEGFGLVYLEAAASSCAVVAAQGGALPEVVVADETGLLVDLDQPGELPEALIRLLLDSQLTNRLGTNGRRHVSTKHGYPLFRARVEGLLERLTRSSQKTAAG